MRGLKNIETAKDFIEGWLVHYNYLRPHTSLDDKTPAEAADIDYPYKNWADITRHKPSKSIAVVHKSRDSIRLEPTNIGGRRKRVRITPKKPRISDLGSGIEINRRTGRGHIKLW
jgi:hypothetical protein